MPKRNNGLRINEPEGDSGLGRTGAQKGFIKTKFAFLFYGAI
jgi:hypothetical protein